MTGRFMDWWKLRSGREQWMLGIMILLLAIVVLWLGIIRPVAGALSAAQARHDDAVLQLGRVEGQVSAIHQLERNPPPALGTSLDKAVAAAATEAGLAPSKVAPSNGDRVDISIPSVKPIAFFAWITVLEARGILVERLSARANSDPTLAVDVTFTKRGR